MFPMEFKFKYQRKKSATEEKLFLYKNRCIVILHWLAAIFLTSASFFRSSVSEINVKAYNMTLYCDEQKFNQPLIPIDKRWPILAIITVSVIVALLTSIRIILYGAKSKEFHNIMNYFLGLLMSWDVTFILQNVISYPIPSFFQNSQLKLLYCCPQCPSQKLTQQLRLLDKKSRGSFPSYLTCASSYVTISLFLLTYHLDEGNSFAAKLISFLIHGSICLIYDWYLFQYNENHLEDIIGGALIGTFFAAYIMRDLFIKDNKLDRFSDDFISVLMAREIELAQLNSRDNSNGQRRNEPNEYTMNLCPQDSTTVRQSATLEDRPPSYSSLELVSV